MSKRFIVMTAAAHMPSSCGYGPYRKVAVVETDGVNIPRQINPRHNAVKDIVKIWDRLYAGKTERCAFRKALAEAENLAARLNEETN